MAALLEMYVQDVSTRRIKAITGKRMERMGTGPKNRAGEREWGQTPKSGGDRP